MRFRKVDVWALAVVVSVLAFVAYRWSAAEVSVAIDVAPVKSKPLPTTPETSDSQRSEQPRSTNTASVARAATRQYNALSLPPRNVQLRDIVGALKRDADSGNYRAACRLAAELQRCKGLQGNSQSLDRLKAERDRSSPESAEYSRLNTTISQQTEKHTRDDIVCDGFENPESLEAWRYVLKAAEGGHVPSMAQFAITPQFNLFDFPANTEAWTAYKQYASSFLFTAANAGDKGAVMVLASGYAGDPDIPGLKLVDVDPFLAAVYTYTSFAFAGERSEINFKNRLLKRLQKVLKPEQLLAAKAQSDSLVAKWPSKRFDLQRKYQREDAPEPSSSDELCEL